MFVLFKKKENHKNCIIPMIGDKVKRLTIFVTRNIEKSSGCQRVEKAKR